MLFWCFSTEASAQNKNEDDDDDDDERLDKGSCHSSSSFNSTQLNSIQFNSIQFILCYRFGCQPSGIKSVEFQNGLWSVTKNAWFCKSGAWRQLQQPCARKTKWTSWTGEQTFGRSGATLVRFAISPRCSSCAILLVVSYQKSTLFIPEGGFQKCLVL